MFIDLDRFKLVNDTLGHVKGDELLQQAAGRLKDCLRRGDTLARLGGDEFTVVLPELRDRQDAVMIADKFLESLAPPVHARRQRSAYLGQHRHRRLPGRRRIDRRTDPQRRHRDVPRQGAGQERPLAFTTVRCSTRPIRRSHWSRVCAGRWSRMNWKCTTSPKWMSGQDKSSAPRP